MSLAAKKCIPCEGGVSPLDRANAEALMTHIPGWELNADATVLSKTYARKDFAVALVLANKIGAVAEAENHHPDLEIGWGKVRVVLSTHSIGGLSENDFILAAKIDALEHEEVI